MGADVRPWFDMTRTMINHSAVASTGRRARGELMVRQRQGWPLHRNAWAGRAQMLTAVAITISPALLQGDGDSLVDMVAEDIILLPMTECQLGLTADGLSRTMERFPWVQSPNSTGEWRAYRGRDPELKGQTNRDECRAEKGSPVALVSWNNKYWKKNSENTWCYQRIKWVKFVFRRGWNMS